MAKKRHFTRSTTIPIAPIIGLVAMPNLQAAIYNAQHGDMDNLLLNLGRIIGADPGGYNVNYLINNMIPLAVGMAIHWAASKLGVNRMLGRAKVPFIRI